MSMRIKGCFKKIIFGSRKYKMDKINKQKAAEASLSRCSSTISSTNGNDVPVTESEFNVNLSRRRVRFNDTPEVRTFTDDAESIHCRGYYWTTYVDQRFDFNDKVYKLALELTPFLHQEHRRRVYTQMQKMRLTSGTTSGLVIVSRLPHASRSVTHKGCSAHRCPPQYQPAPTLSALESVIVTVPRFSRAKYIDLPAPVRTVTVQTQSAIVANSKECDPTTTTTTRRQPI